MNTEELERSLRAEFDEHLIKVLADARIEFESLQKRLEAEFDSQKAQMEESFRALNSRLESPPEFDQAFSEAVVEHLRLARDEGARVTATAMDAAEQLNNVPAVSGQDFGQLRDAIAEIKSKPSQAAILRSLVDAAANFAPRGAFFIVKNDHLVGWKAFGSEVEDSEVRSIHFPLNSDTLLCQAVGSLSVRCGFAASAGENSKFLEPLGFGSPQEMIAVPLSARGRGVAVLYADGGAENAAINTAALDALVSVASLTVEMLAANSERPAEHAAPQAAEAVQETVQAETEYSGDVAVAVEPESVSEFKVETASEDAQPEPEQTSDFAFSENNFSEQQSEEPVPEEVETTAPVNVISEQTRRRRSDWAVDLPIEVSDEERRPHSDARRFARLLVSEIKMYNEKKVLEGRERGEIYEFLREAIDRSREMYDKRVQPDVAAKFDYFHYELVNNLAEGEEEKLGAGYLALKV